MSSKLAALIVRGMTGGPVVVDATPTEAAHALNSAGTYLVSFALDNADGARVFVNPAHVALIVEAVRSETPAARAPRIHLA